VTTYCYKASLMTVSDPDTETSCYIYCINLNPLDDEEVGKINAYVAVI